MLNIEAAVPAPPLLLSEPLSLKNCICIIPKDKPFTIKENE